MSPPIDDPHALLLEVLPRIEQLIASYCRRHRVPEDEAEELASEVKLKLVADDCAVLRQFQGRCTLDSYLTTVVHHLLLDLRIAEHGKWRASSGARALGTLGVELEREIDRDRRGIEEAIQIVAGRSGTSIEEVRRIAQALPLRPLGRSRASDFEPNLLPSPEPDPETKAQLREAHQARAELLEALGLEVAALPPEDRLAVRLRFAEGLEISAIADLLGLPRRPFYRHLERLLVQLRQGLRRRGINADDALSVISPDEIAENAHVSTGFLETAGSRPSNVAEAISTTALSRSEP